MKKLRIVLAVLLAAAVAAPAVMAAGVQRPQKPPTLGKKQGGSGKNKRNNRNNQNHKQQKAQPAAKKTSSGNTTAEAAGTGDRLEPVLTAPPSSTTASGASDDAKIRQARTRLSAVQDESQALATVKERLVLGKWKPDQVMDAEGNTLLHQAAGNGYLSVVQCLLAEGADPTVRNKILQTPADLARAIQRTDIEEALKAAAAKRGTPAT